MKKILLLSTISFLLIAFAKDSKATLTDCQNLHIGRIWIEKGAGLKAVVYLNNRGDSSGSYWSLFTGWTAEERKEVLSTLMTAKAANHRVNVVTETAGGCGLVDDFTVTKSVFLTTNP